MSGFICKLSITTFFLVILINVKVLCYKIQRVTVPEKGNGVRSTESPQWSVQENALYWANNFGQQKVFRMDGTTGKITSRSLCYGSPYLIVPVKDHPGWVVVAIRSSLFLLRWGAPGGDLALRVITTVDAGKPDNKINDGKADAKGRLFFGTFGAIDFSLPTLVHFAQGTLYSIDNCNYAEATIKKRPVGLSNGIAWSLDNKKMYYNDSPTRKIVAFDYDLDKGTIVNETVVFRFDDHHNLTGVPDGMTIDNNGNLWVACFQDAVVIQVDPVCGVLLKMIELPVDQVTSVMWGGPHLEHLFVTTAGVNTTDPKPLSGAIFSITGLGTKGVPENQFLFDADKY